MNQNSTITTQYVDGQPVVCLLTNRSEVGAGLQNSLLLKPVNLDLISTENDLVIAEIEPKLETAYKIIWSVDIEWWLGSDPRQLRMLLDVLANYQSKLTIVLPTNSGFKEMVSGEFPYWQMLQQTQVKAIAQLSSDLPNAIFVFGFDLVGGLKPESEFFSPQYSTPLMMCQQIQGGVVYAPQMTVFPQTILRFSKKATHIALSPNRRSFAIQGSSITGIKLAQQIKQLYQSYHFCPLDLQVIDGFEQDPLVFSVEHDFITSQEDLIERFVSNLPSPTGKKTWLNLDLLETNFVVQDDSTTTAGKVLQDPYANESTPIPPSDKQAQISWNANDYSENLRVMQREDLGLSMKKAAPIGSGRWRILDGQSNVANTQFSPQSSHFSTNQIQNETRTNATRRVGFGQGDVGDLSAHAKEDLSLGLGFSNTPLNSPKEPPARSRLAGKQSQTSIGKKLANIANQEQYSPPEQYPPLDRRIIETNADLTINEPKKDNGEEQHFNLNSELQRIFAASHRASAKNKSAHIKKQKIHISKKSNRRTAVFYGGLAFTGVGLGALCLAVFFLISVKMLRQDLSTALIAFTDAEYSELNLVSASDEEKLNSNLEGGENTEHKTTNNWQSTQDRNSGNSQSQVLDLGANSNTVDYLKSLHRLTKIVALQANSYQKIFSLPQIDEAIKLAETGSGLIETQQQLVKINQLSQKLVGQVLGLSGGEIEVTTEDLASQSLLAYEKLATFNSSLNEISLSTETTRLIDQHIFERTEKLASGLQVMKQLQPLLPALLGADQPRTYAVVFQNNQELRPTGGYIEAIGIFTFAEGSLIKQDFYNGLQIDNLLPGSVQAPDDIRQYLGEKVWSIRDANWDPSFPKTAEQISWFLEKGLNQDIDGVMTVDIEGLANLLQAIGPVEVPEYNEVLTQKNLAEYVEFHSEVVNEVVVKDYRQLVFEKIWMEIFQISPHKASRLLAAFQTNFDQQHSLIAFRRSEELAAMTNLSWSGALFSPDCPTQFVAANCQVESVAQIEANVGVNRANYYLKRAIEHSVEFTNTAALHTRQVIFENTAQSESWPKGPYKTYVRFYLPENAVISEVRASNQPIDEKFVKQYQEHNRQVVGVYFEVPVKSSKTLTIVYSTPLPTDDQFAYAFFEQLQPGAGEPNYSLEIKPAANQRVELVAPQAEITNDKVVFSHRILKHGFFGIQVAREN